jgi:hypothetical protein
MKKLVISVVTLINVLVTCSFAGLWTSFQGLQLPVVKCDKIYQLEVIGQNLRVYEFTTQCPPKRHCVIVFTGSEKKSPVMQCWPK